MRSSPGCVSLPRAPCCVRLAKKYAHRWLRCALAAFCRSNLAVGPRFWSLRRHFGAPGLNFRRRNGCFFDAFACARSCAANMLRLCFGHIKTDVSCTSELSRDMTRSARSRSKMRLQAFRKAFSHRSREKLAPSAPRDVPRAPRWLQERAKMA